MLRVEVHCTLGCSTPQGGWLSQEQNSAREGSEPGIPHATDQALGSLPMLTVVLETKSGLL